MSPFGDADFLSGRTNVVDPCGQEWQSHWIDNWSLLLILEGKGEIELETGCLPVVKQDLVLIAPGYPHKFRCPGQWVLLWVHFLMRPHLCPLPGWTECQPGARCCNLPKREFLRVRSALQEACLLDLRRAPNWYLLAYCLLESVVLRGCRVAAENTSNENVWLPLAQRCCSNRLQMIFRWTGSLPGAGCRGQNSIQPSNGSAACRRAPIGNFTRCAGRNCCWKTRRFRLPKSLVRSV